MLRTSRPGRTSIGQLIESLAIVPLRAQERLDDRCALRGKEFDALLRDMDDDVAAALLESVRPVHLVVDETKVSIDLLLTIRQSSPLGVGISLLGRPVSSFLSIVTRDRSTERTGIKFIVSRSMLPAGPGQSKQEGDDP